MHVRWANTTGVIGLSTQSCCEPEDYGRRSKKARSYDGGNHDLEIGGFPGTPLNGKRFWRKQSGHP